MFGRAYKVSLNRVYDVVEIKEGGDTLRLTVNGDAMRMVAGLAKVQTRLSGLNDDTPDEEVLASAKYFATVIFGAEQANKLCDFYANDPACVISVCGQYFKNRLSALITKAQKKMKV